MRVTGRQLVAAMAFIGPLFGGQSIASAQSLVAPQSFVATQPQPVMQSPSGVQPTPIAVSDVENSVQRPDIRVAPANALVSVRTSVRSVSAPTNGGFPGPASPLAGVIEEALDIDTNKPEVADDDSVAEEVSASDSFDPENPGESLAPLRNRELTTEVNVVNLSLDGIGTGILPEGAFSEQSVATIALPDGYSRGATSKCVHWRPSMIAHHPLIFEDAVLERHGHTRWGHFEPVASGAKFYAAILLHPYLNTLNRPWECQYALGHYRAGTCAPVLKNHLPYDARAAAVQGLSTAGLFWAAPLAW